MPDIAMCLNDECPLRVSCYRFLAVPNEYRQSYSKFEPNINNTILDEVECNHFIEINNKEIKKI